MDLPLSESLRPRTLDEFVGQKHLVGEGMPVRMAIEKGHKFSFLLWGPPGVGKTTLAKIYARSLGYELYELSAVSASKDDVRMIVGKEGRGKVLFLDEIHRFNKSQQDFLLPYVESGELILVGATTENPSFEVIAPLLSRCRVYVLEGLGEEDFRELGRRVGGKLGIDLSQAVVAAASGMVNGDGRRFINLIGETHRLFGGVDIERLEKVVGGNGLRYDRAGDEHYDTISAFIKSMRAGDVDAALYYLARMIEAGEDPLFVARRMVVFASEDIGMAQPTALVVANEVFRACETVGLPECAINLAHGVVYLARAPKDRRAYDGLMMAREDVRKYGNLPIPKKLRNAVTNLMKGLGYGKGYEMYKKGNLPEKLGGKTYFRESDG